jgi:sortase A
VTLPSVDRAAPARWAERLLFGAGSLCLGLAVLGWAEGFVFQRLLDWRLERAFAEGADTKAPSAPSPARLEATPPPRTEAAAPPARELPPSPEAGFDVGEPIGRLVAPRLRLSAVVAEGVSNATLRRAVGHIPGTALPWEPDGNVGLAAHRDTFFWRLKDVKVGDALRLVTPRGRFDYVVRSLEVVDPARADLLDRRERPTLTLVTCYPFSVVGPAPSRFVVSADRVDGVPAGPAPAPPERPFPTAFWTVYKPAHR